MAIKTRYWTSLHGITTIILVGTALYFIFAEHSAHVLPYLPFLIILLCPLMHIFMHKGHGGGEGHSQSEHNHQNEEEAYHRGMEEGRKENQKRKK
ncbi:DUF2933 domain-containing protein [Pseudohongiella sp. O18]|uniref:DUF2933 domain-containing protein n=1 Tax=Pseudohongiella sp. O18 TaxID=2904248 RepID=UPI001F39569F|nr:DUF2933 domain-containing protein [Pseudohongiella sp. O18]